MPKAASKSLLDVHPREIKGIVKDIPTLPVIYQELFKKMQDPNIHVAKLAEIISQDQSLSTKILHLVNSAFYGYNKQINTISRAVVILGFQAVRSAALATSVFDYFGDEQSNGIDMAKFWEHSIATAGICKVLATNTLPDHKEDAFIVGLLHDVGKLIIKRYFSNDFDSIVEVADEQQLTWHRTEKELFQTNHATIGKTVFRAWDFPPAVVEAVFCHHQPSTASKHLQLTALVHIGDYISYEMGYGAPGAVPPSGFDTDALKALDILPEQIGSYSDAISAEIEQAMEITKLIG